MKGTMSWNYTPYCQFDRHSKCNDPHIVRLASTRNGFDIEWIANLNCDSYHLCVKEREGAWQQEYALTEKQFSITGLKENTDYEVYIASESGVKSKFRLVRTGFTPGVMINYLHPEDQTYAFSGQYLCSPSVVRLPNGKLIVSMDVFNRDKPQNHTILFQSEDGGNSWDYLTEIHPCFWGKLFMHKGELYLLGISGQYGDVLIGKSLDEGKTWTKPVTLFYGSCLAGEGFHRAPCVITSHDGRLWTSIEYGSWKINGFCNCVLSADESHDLMDVENWIISTPYRQEAKSPAIEGNVVVSPEGEVINFLRYKYEEALLLKADTKDPDRSCILYKKIKFPMGNTKFEIKKHKNGRYYAIGNDDVYERSKLSIYSSLDLENWQYEVAVVDYSYADRYKVGFQYPSFIFEEDGFLVISRTAFNHATNFHDNNCITCHKVQFDFSVHGCE